MSQQIIPAVLTDSAEQAKSQISALVGLTDWVQIDVMDGVFVTQQSFDLTALNNFSAFTKINWEAHLMVEEPDQYLALCQRLGCRRVYIHRESRGFSAAVLNQAHDLGLQVGLALKPNTPARKLKPYLHQITAVLLLAVEPGSQGQRLRRRALWKARRIKQWQPDLLVAIDGGVKPENIQQVFSYGVDAVSVGSAIFNNTSVKENLENLNKKLEIRY
ncbi:hypothetical protein HY933_01625 [Candidatus Falkowbacteria bacterium]|nr:hypothetical protein [Candidatus Falkowbacteria bacterium]